MARIFISMAGEGRGHATRVRALTEELRTRHEITLFAPGDAHDLLEPVYRGSDVRICAIPCLRFHYTPRHRLAYGRTTTEAARYLSGLHRLVRQLEGVLRFERPDLVISDFEPALPRAARAAGVPFVSVNHQHFLVVSDLSSLPGHLRAHAAAMGMIVRAFHRHEEHRVVSSFYFPPLKPGFANTTQVGVFLRPSVRDAVPRRDGHLVAYLRKFAPRHVLDALASCGREVRVYGAGDRGREGALWFRPIDEHSFVDDLATGDALVTTAGNQLVGEALHLGKPVLALPEEGNQEQYINAHFLRAGGGGDWMELADMSPARLDAFLARLDGFPGHVDRHRLDGTPAAVQAIEDRLACRSTARATRPVPCLGLAGGFAS